MEDGVTSLAKKNLVTGKWDVTITLNSNLVSNGTQIAVAKTIFHETIHAYLRYIQKTNPIGFNSPTGDYADMVAAYAVHNNLNYAQHVYMANLIENVGCQLQQYAINHLGYPSNDSSYLPEGKNFYYEAVSWSGIGLIEDPNGIMPYIENPVFLNEYPNLNDREKIFYIFSAENIGASTGGQTPLVNNNCN